VHASIVFTTLLHEIIVKTNCIDKLRCSKT